MQRLVKTGSWTEVSVRVVASFGDDVAEFLHGITETGVVTEPTIDALGPDEGYTLDLAAPLLLKAYFYGRISPARRRAVRRALSASGLAGAVAGTLHWREIREEDWAESWKQYYEIERVGAVVIRPAWLEYEAEPGEVVVALDPGMAFGTGQHPTTRMCLAALQGVLRPGDRVLDLGTGSGILALAAAALGAGACVAVDIEEQAVAAARANVALNNATAPVDVRLGSIEAGAGEGPFDLVLANINAAAITGLAPQISDAMRPGATLFAGGIIAERLAAPFEALRAAGLEVERVMDDGDWRTIVARRRTHAQA